MIELDPTHEERLAQLRGHILRRAIAGAAPAPALRLGRIVFDPKTLRFGAYFAARANGASCPGVDRVTLCSLDATELEDLVAELAEELRQGKYRPLGLRRLVTKADERGKRRKLGVPAVRDRFVAYAILLLLEPLVLALLTPNVFAVWPNGGTHAALAAIVRALESVEGPCHIIRADIRSFFDDVPHDVILRLLRRHLGGGRLLRVAQAQLRKWQAAPGRGLPLGAPTSPAFANLLLASVDRFFLRRSTVRYFRYADDIVIIVSGEKKRAEVCLEELRELVRELGLRLSGEKTRIFSPGETFAFLGTKLRRDADGRVVCTDKRNPPSAEASVPDAESKKDFQLATATWPGNFFPLSPTQAIVPTETGRREEEGQQQLPEHRSRDADQDTPKGDPTHPGGGGITLVEVDGRTGRDDVALQRPAFGPAPNSGTEGSDGGGLASWSNDLLHLAREMRVSKNKIAGRDLDVVQGALQQVGESIRTLRSKALSTHGSIAAADAGLARSDDYRRLISVRGKLKAMAAELNEELLFRRQTIAKFDAEIGRRRAKCKFLRNPSGWERAPQ